MSPDINLNTSIVKNKGKERTIEGVLFDANYSLGFSGNSQYPVINLKVFSEDDGLVNIEYKKFKPYGLFEINDFVDFDTLKSKLITEDYVLSVDETTRKSMRPPHREIRMIKVRMDIPKRVAEKRDDIVKAYDGIVKWHECDIRFIRRFVIDKDIDFMRNVEVDVSVDRKGDEVSYVIEDVDNIEYRDYADPYDIRVKNVTFDLEVRNPDVSVDPSEDPIIMIGTTRGRVGDEDFEERIFRLDDYEGSRLDKERSMITDFIYWVNDYDPYFLSTYNGTNFDIHPYFMERCEELHINPHDIAGDDGNGEIYVSDRGFDNKSIRIPGMINHDVYLTAKRDMTTSDDRLETVADHLDVMDNDERVSIPGPEIYRYWDSGGVRRELLSDYCMDDTVATHKLAQGTLFLINCSISRICGVPYSVALDGGYGSVDAQLLNIEYSKRGFVLPRRRHKKERDYTGAEVNIEKSGFMFDVDCLDYSGMYPNIAKRDNLSHETYLGRKGEFDTNYKEIYISKHDIKHKFDQDYDDAVIPHVIDYFFDERDKHKQKWKDLPEDHPKKDVLDTLQYTYKRLVNTLYGMAGATVNRYYFLPIAESITAGGREAIMKIFEIIREDFDKEVYYGDTDSGYIEGFGSPEQRENMEYIPEREKFINVVEDETGLEIELDYQIPVLVLIGRKKKYFFAKREKDGDLNTKIKGLESVRGDTPGLIGDELSDAIDTLLYDVLMECRHSEIEIDDRIDLAIEDVNNLVNNLRDYDFEVNDLVVYTKLSKSLDEYDSGHGQQHVSVAEREITEYGNMIHKKGNERIPWIIVKSRAVSTYYPNFADDHTIRELKDNVCKRAVLGHRVDDVYDVDVDYYIDRVIDTFDRVFGVFGVNQKSLSDAEHDPGDALDKAVEMF